MAVTKWRIHFYHMKGADHVTTSVIEECSTLERLTERISRTIATNGTYTIPLGNDRYAQIPGQSIQYIEYQKVSQ